MLRATIAAATLGPLAGWACALTFPCNADEQCTRDGAAGVCQASGYCSFPDESCDGGQRYGELAPGELAGTCVPPADAGGTDTATGDDGATIGTSTVGPPSTDGLDVVDGLDGTVTDSGTDDSSSDDDTTTGVPACCYAGCEGTCDAGCDKQLFGGPFVGGEAIGVAVVGEWVVWSTGFGFTLELSSVTDGSLGTLADFDNTQLITRIAADDTHVYFLNHGGPLVRRASVPMGGVDVVSMVDQGMAGFGGLAVGADHVYFAMNTTGGIWRAAKDLSDQGGAQLVADVAGPHDVALDDTTVYWVDTGQQRISSLAFDQIGTGEAPAIVYTGSELRALTIDATHVYFSDGSSIVRAVKDGQDQGIETLATAQGLIWSVAVDWTHVYWTSETNDELARVQLTGGEVEVLAETSTPWGLALGCHAAFWAENGTQTLQRVLK